MKLDNRSTSFKIHWQNDDALSEGAMLRCVDDAFTQALLTQHLENMGSDAIHVLSFWNQLQQELLDAKEHPETIKWMDLIEKVQVLEDLYWGLELTLAQRHGHDQ